MLRRLGRWTTRTPRSPPDSTLRPGDRERQNRFPQTDLANLQAGQDTAHLDGCQGCEIREIWNPSFATFVLVVPNCLQVDQARWRKNRFIARRYLCGDNLSVRFHIQNSISLTLTLLPRII